MKMRQFLISAIRVSESKYVQPIMRRCRMARITASSLKAIVEKSKVDRKTNDASDRNRTREEKKLWGLLLKEAIDGNQEVCLQNLEPIDVRFLTGTGLKVEEQFKRSLAKSILDEEIDNLEVEAGDWESELDHAGDSNKKLDSQKKLRDFSYIGNWNNIKKETYVVTDDEEDIDDDRTITEEDEEKFLNWLSANQTIAYECDLEQWFGVELSYIQIFSPECLDDLIKKIESILLRSKNNEQLKAIKKLSSIAAKAKINYKKHIVSERIAAQKQKSAIQRINDIRNDPNFQWEDDIDSLHLISWAVIEKTKKIDFYDARVLVWAANSGQDFFQEIEEIIVRLAKNQETSIRLTSLPVSQATRFDFNRGDVIDDFDYSVAETPIRRWAPNPTLVSELLKISGYKVNVTKPIQGASTLTISWA